MAEQKSVDKTKEKIKKGIEADIKSVQNTADLLSGKASIGTTRLNSSKKVADPFAKLDDPKNLNKFLKFMERNYKSGLMKVELKKKV